jgi:hypothetical protein
VKRLAALALALWLPSPGLRCDVRPAEISADLDGELARAADLLEGGSRAEAEAILEAIRRRAGLPAWEARAALLLASDDARRQDWTAAAARLEAASAASIGLDPYRQLRRAEALELAGRPDEALQAARSAFEAEGPFAFRARAAIVTARLLEQRREVREAAAVLALASVAASTPAESAEIAILRIRLGLAGKDAAAVRSAARDLLLEAPTFDGAKTTPEFARRSAAEAERGLSPAERGRRGRALVAAGDARRGVPLLQRDRLSEWPEGERGQNQLALARGQLALEKSRTAEASAALVPDDGTLASYEARLFRCDRVTARLRGVGRTPLSPDDPRLEPVKRALEGLTAPAVPVSVRRTAHERLLKLSADADRFDDALPQARQLSLEDPGSIDGFEALWLAAWRKFSAGDFAGARVRFEALSEIYRDISRSRRLSYWRARCLVFEGREGEAAALFAGLASASPPDVYAVFARERAANAAPAEREEVRDPSTATAAFARVDELLRLRMFEEASAEARAADRAGRFRARPLSSRGDCHQARAARGRDGRGGPRAGRLAAALLPDRGRGLSPAGRERVRAGSRGAARPGAAGERLRRERPIPRRRDGADAADAGDREEPRPLGPARALPARVPLRSGRQREARRRLPAPPDRPVRRLDASGSGRLQRRAHAHRPAAPREPRPPRGRALRVDPVLRDPRLRPPGPALFRVVPGALSLIDSTHGRR